MKFDDLDRHMRVYETAHDHRVLPGIWIAARLDGRNFTRLCRERAKFEAPFDVRFRDMMVSTAAHLMDCGFKVLYSYTQSDEISLLFDFNIDLFGRKTRKYNSILSGEASAKFSLLLAEILEPAPRNGAFNAAGAVCAVFDCRLSQLPAEENVIDYFRWRSEDAHRNSLNAHCYWLLRRENKSAEEATAALEGISTAGKNELLFSRGGVNYNDLPAWQKRGAGLFWKDGKIQTDFDLPFAGAYDDYIAQFLARE